MQVFEEREYRCFGQWEEEETGLVYTYTDRRDVPGSECFVGKTIDGDRNVIAEAGANCERGHQPDKYGMTLHRQAKCPHDAQPPTAEEGGGGGGGGGGQPGRGVAPETIDQFLEREEQDRVLHETRAFTPKPVGGSGRRNSGNRRNKHRKHHSNGGGDRDIFSNEIPGSSPREHNAAAAASRSSVLLCLVASLWTLLLCATARTIP